MVSQQSGYLRRANSDGTTDSICRFCFATVVTAVWEAELDRAEREHTCDPAVLEHWRTVADPERRKTAKQNGP